MNNNRILLPTYYIAQIGEEISQRGVDPDAWLAAANLCTNQIKSQKGAIELDQFKHLILSAISLSGEPGLGLMVGRNLGLTTHGMLGYAISASSCLREAVELFSRYLNTRTPLLRIETSSSDDVFSIELHLCYPLDKIEIPFLESAVVTIINMIKQVTENKPPIKAIRFPFKQPSYRNLYDEIFSCSLTFKNSVACICLLKEQIDKPLPMANEMSLEQAKAICEQELSKLQMQQSFSQRVRKRLLSYKDGFPSLREIAEHFNYSQRTFHRRLKEDNTCYSDILKSVRRFKATTLLIHSNLSVLEISYSLGYSDIANFRKAFKTWEGRSPSEFRLINLTENGND